MKSYPTDARTSRPSRTMVLLATLTAAALAVLPHVLAAATPVADRAVATTSAGSARGIWSDSAVPAVPTAKDRRSVSLGLKFSSARNGRLRGVQYYAAGANRVATTGSVWSQTGRRIARVRFPATSTDGWKTATLSSPVRIRAGKKYTVSYRAPRGRYATERHVFASSRTVSARGLTAHRGTFTYGAGRPTRTSKGSHYFIDVVFAPKRRTATTTPTSTPTATPTSTPTPTPSADMKGWELTPTNVGLAPHGLSCASLPAYSGPGQLASGTTISGKLITVPLDVSAGNIVIEKSCFKPTSSDVGLVEGYYPQGDITIQDSEFDGSLLPPAQRAAACAFTGGASLTRNYMHDVGNGICMVSSTNTRDMGTLPKHIVIKNNYVHKLFHYGDAHQEAATIRDFVKSPDDSRTMTWIGNFLDSDTLNISGGLFIQPTFEPIYNVWLNDNVFAGEGCNLVTGDSTGVNVVRNLHVVNNRFKAGTREWYGPVNPGSGPGIVEWTANALYDAGKPDARGAVVTP